MNLNQITIHVKNIRRSIEFYEKLGLILIVDSPKNGYARLECPEGRGGGAAATFSLHEAENVASADASFYFEVDDVDARVADLKSKGLTFETEPTDQTWLWREAWTRDPDGYRIGIYHAGDNRRFPPWRIDAKAGGA